VSSSCLMPWRFPRWSMPRSTRSAVRRCSVVGGRRKRSGVVVAFGFSFTVEAGHSRAAGQGPGGHPSRPRPPGRPARRWHRTPRRGDHAAISRRRRASQAGESAGQWQARPDRRLTPRSSARAAGEACLRAPWPGRLPARSTPALAVLGVGEGICAPSGRRPRWRRACSRPRRDDARRRR